MASDVAGAESICARRVAGVSLLGVLLTVLLTWPLAGKLNSAGRVDSFDGQWSLWSATWVARTLVSQPLRVYDANIHWPHRRALAFSEPNLLAGLLGIPAYLLTRSPYATHNSAVLAYFFLSFLSAYALGRYLTGDTYAGLVCGIGYAFCPFVFARTAHIHLLGTFGLPLSLLAMHRLVNRPGVGRGLALAAALWLQALACGYYALFALLAVAAGLLFFAFTSQRWRSRAYLGAILIAVVAGVALLLPLVLPHLRLEHTEGFTRPVDEARLYAANWEAWLASSAWAHRWMLPWLGRWSEVLFPGFLTAILGLTGAWLGLSNRLTRSPGHPVTAPSLRSITVFYVLLGGVAAWCAFGPAGGLYALFYRTLPFFALIRGAGRFGIVTTLALTVLMAFAVAHLRRRQSPSVSRLVGLVLAAGLAAELCTAPLGVSEAVPVSPAYRTLARLPKGPVVEFPFFSRPLHLNAQYMLASTAHWRPLVNGYGAFMPRDTRRLAAATETFPSDESLETLRQWGVRYVVVHPALYDLWGVGHWSDILARLDEEQDRLRLIEIAPDDVWLYEMRNWRVVHRSGE